MEKEIPVLSESAREEVLIRSFFKKNKHERLNAFSKSKKNRKKFVAGLAHVKDIEEKFIQPIPPGNQTASKIEHLLKRNGAPATCYLISERAELDQKECNLTTTLSQIVGSLVWVQ